jgi:hypothetical protein
MSLFQCENCGCLENTACAAQGFKPEVLARCFDWTDIEHLRGKLLCSVCGPTKYRGGAPTEFGKWHNQFRRIMLPIGQFKTNSVGNLEHIYSGSTNLADYEISHESIDVPPMLRRGTD